MSPADVRRSRRSPATRLDERRAEQLAAAEQLLRLRVVLHHAPGAVEHQHAVLHVLDHQLVDARLRGELAAALAREALVGRHARGEPAGDAGGGEEARSRAAPAAGSSRWARRAPAPSRPARAAARWSRARHRGRRGGAARRSPRAVSEISSITPRPLRMPPLAHMSSVMATMSRQACSRELQLELVAQVAQHAVQHHAAEQIARGDVAEQLQAVQPEAERVAVDQRGAEEHRRQHHAVQVEVAQRGPERLRDALLGRRARARGTAAARAPRLPSAAPGAEARVLLAAEQQRRRPGAPPSAAGARRSARSAPGRRCSGGLLARRLPRVAARNARRTSQTASDDEQDQHEEPAHRAIIYGNGKMKREVGRGDWI